MLLIAVCMGFGNHLVAHHIEHCTSGKSQQHGQHSLRDGAKPITEHHAHNLEQADCRGDEKCAKRLHPGKQQRRNHHHTFGNVLQRDAKRHRPGIAQVGSVVESHTCRHAFGQLVYGNSHHKQHDAVDAAVLAVLFRLDAGDVVKVRRSIVEHVEEQRTKHHAHNHHPPLRWMAEFGSRHNQSQHRCAKHNAGAIAQNSVVPVMRQALDGKAQHRAEHGCQAQCHGANQYVCHNSVLNNMICCFLLQNYIT